MAGRGALASARRDGEIREAPAALGELARVDSMLSFAAMASVRIAIRIPHPDHEKALRKASAALPDDWSVEISQNPGVGIHVRVTGTGVAYVKTFASGTPADLVGYLQDLSR
jgi:hypothetical protein